MLRWNFQIGQILLYRIHIDQLEKLLPNPPLLNHYTLQNIVIIYSEIKPVSPHVVENLTLRRPLRHSWRIGLFFSSHGSALTVFPKRWKNIPHKSCTADFFQYFIFLLSACEIHKTRLKILDSDSTYYGVYLFLDFGFFSQSSCFLRFKNVLWNIQSCLTRRRR